MPQRAQLVLPRQEVFEWPNLWHFKQRSGLGMYGRIGHSKYPAFNDRGSFVEANVSITFL